MNTKEPLKELENKLNVKWVNGLKGNKDFSVLEITTNSLKELTETMTIIHDYLNRFTSKHPEVGYSMKANRLNPDDNTKHILKVTVGE
jgi:hypothetical protein